MRPKWYQNGPSKEEEQRRRQKRAEKRKTSSRERLGSALERHPSILGVPRGGSVECATGFALPHRPCVSAGLGPTSEEKCCKVARFRDLAISLIFVSQ